MLHRARPWLGTLVDIRIDADTSAIESAALEAAFTAIADVHHAMSFHESDSELSQLNRTAAIHAVAVSSLTAEVLREALRLASASNGIFDPTIAFALVAAGARPRPLAADVDAHASWRDVDVDDSDRVRFRRPLWLDFGGIAKGYAVDRALATARAHGAVAACVNAGGDLAVFGEIEERVHLRMPGKAIPMREIAALRDGAVAASSTGDDTLITHFDARSRRTLNTQRTAAVFAARCIHADALTKVVLCDPLAAQPLLMQFNASAFVIDAGHAPRHLGIAA